MYGSYLVKGNEKMKTWPLKVFARPSEFDSYPDGRANTFHLSTVIFSCFHLFISLDWMRPYQTRYLLEVKEWVLILLGYGRRGSGGGGCSFCIKKAKRAKALGWCDLCLYKGERSSWGWVQRLPGKGNRAHILPWTQFGPPPRPARDLSESNCFLCCV